MEVLSTIVLIVFKIDYFIFIFIIIERAEVRMIDIDEYLNMWRTIANQPFLKQTDNILDNNIQTKHIKIMINELKLKDIETKISLYLQKKTIESQYYHIFNKARRRTNPRQRRRTNPRQRYRTNPRQRCRTNPRQR